MSSLGMAAMVGRLLVSGAAPGTTAFSSVLRLKFTCRQGEDASHPLRATPGRQQAKVGGRRQLINVRATPRPIAAVSIVSGAIQGCPVDDWRAEEHSKPSRVLNLSVAGTRHVGIKAHVRGRKLRAPTTREPRSTASS